MFGRKKPDPVSTALRPPPERGEVVNRCCGGGCAKGGPVKEDEGPGEHDLAAFGGVTHTCPACKKEIYDDTEICYHCGHAMQGTSAGSSSPPTWIIMTALAVAAGVVLLVLFRGRLF